MAFIFFRLILLAMVLGAAAIVGQMVAGHKGAVAGSILASLFIYALHVRSGLRIIEWLDNFKVENVPDVSGWWDDLAATTDDERELLEQDARDAAGDLQSPP